MDAIRTSIRNTGIIDRLLNRPVQGQGVLVPEAGEEPQGTVFLVPPASQNGMSRESELPAAGRDADAVSPASPRASEIPAAPDDPLAETPPGQTVPSADPRKNAEDPVVQPDPPIPAEPLRDRVLYLMQVDPDGTILRTRVTRSLPVTSSPMVDALNALLLGPSAEEKNRDLISLIPKGTRILSAVVRGSTAYINFNENFLFNEYGVEGYAGQLRQIVWTATEFPNVKDVQILIEGRRIDYLGESIWIGGPVGRESR